MSQSFHYLSAYALHGGQIKHTRPQELSISTRQADRTVLTYTLPPLCRRRRAFSPVLVLPSLIISLDMGR